MNQAQKIALFDFDGTITYNDSMFEFIMFCSGKFKFYLGFLILSPFLILNKAGLISSQKTKEIVLAYFLKNFSKIKVTASHFSKTVLPKLIKKSALEKISKLKEEGYSIYIVSASASLWLQEWCDATGLHLIATELEIIDNKITGKILGKNCKGIEKANRIKKKFENQNIIIEFAFGDSAGDKEMLLMANKSFYKYFN